MGEIKTKPSEKRYLVKQVIWDSPPSLQEATRRPQPIVQEGPPWGPYAGMVKLAFPYHWFSREDLEEVADE